MEYNDTRGGLIQGKCVLSCGAKRLGATGGGGYSGKGSRYLRKKGERDRAGGLPASMPGGRRGCESAPAKLLDLAQKGQKVECVCWCLYSSISKVDEIIFFPRIYSATS